ncbi:MAG: heme-binding protein [Gammaproteobacteria bacterium]|nr:heme-binding protein [Gammaproteobacteria bacterium]
MAIEEPDYEVLQSTEHYEVRRYDPYIIAEVDVSGCRNEAGNLAFRILAGYIFGDNRSRKKMEMTAPVSSRSADSIKMDMTAPVTSVTSTRGEHTFAFVMEKKYTLDTLPVPNDERIRIRVMPERIMAVRQYSGRWSESNYQQNESALLRALDADGIEPLEAPILARYNAPFTPWFLRRNESMVEIDWPV